MNFVDVVIVIELGWLMVLCVVYLYEKGGWMICEVVMAKVYVIESVCKVVELVHWIVGGMDIEEE